MIFKKTTIYVLLVSILICCRDNKSESVKSKYNIVSDQELLGGWKTFVDDSIKVNLPLNWKPKSVDDLLLYVPLDKNNNSYFVILKNDNLKIRYKNYLKEIFRQVSQKDKEFNYLIRKVYFEGNKNCYTLELFTDERGEKYITYCFIYQKGNNIYDFSYKTINNEDSNIENYRIFYNVIFSFKFKNNLIIDSEDFIVKDEEILKYEDLP